jgi:hypothetical protein
MSTVNLHKRSEKCNSGTVSSMRMRMIVQVLVILVRCSEHCRIQGSMRQLPCNTFGSGNK